MVRIEISLIMELVTVIRVISMTDSKIKIVYNAIISVLVVLNFHHVNFAKAKTEIYLI
jgi:hypothetical protein